MMTYVIWDRFALLLLGIASLWTFSGCWERQSRKLELHFEREPGDEFTVDILITRDAPPPRTKGNVVEIPVSADGSAMLPSTHYIEQWHQWNVVTPSAKYGHLDLETIDSNWKMATVDVSRSESKTVKEGSHYVIRIKKLKREKEPNESDDIN
jgi:hypothetical protein